MFCRITRAVLLAALAVVLGAPTAQAAFPGANGKIAFHRDGDIYTIDPDGTDLTNLTGAAGTSDLHPAWSPDGRKIAFTRLSNVWREIYTMNPDGTGVTQVTNLFYENCIHDLAWSPDQTMFVFLWDCGDRPEIFRVNADGSGVMRLTVQNSSSDRKPAWSPDGQKIAFTRDSGAVDIYTINPDGTGMTRLTNGTVGIKDGPDWSPDGRRILFTGNLDGQSPVSRDVYAMNRDGSGITRMTSTTGLETDAVWSPDGRRVAFSRCDDLEGCFYSFPPTAFLKLFVMNGDGGGVAQLTTGVLDDGRPDWQPLRGLDPYPRPGGGTPLRVSFVPAYEQCTSATQNSNHVAPLALDSCSPPVQVSDLLTTSTIGQMRGHVRLDVQVGNSTTAADEADVRIESQIGDVRNASDQSDYAGELILRSILRITDRASGFGGVSATVEDFHFDVPLSCTPTATSPRGSDCGVSTTADTLVPGFAKEGKRAVISTFRFEAMDAGADGDVTPASGCPPTCGTGDEATFLTQGTFAP